MPDTTQKYPLLRLILGKYNVLVNPGNFRLNSKKSSRPTLGILCEKSKYLLILIMITITYLLGKNYYSYSKSSLLSITISFHDQCKFDQLKNNKIIEQKVERYQYH